MNGADDSSQDVHTAHDDGDVFTEFFIEVFGGKVGTSGKRGHYDDGDGEGRIVPGVMFVASAMEPAVRHCFIAPLDEDVFVFFGPCGWFIGCGHLQGGLLIVFK